MTGLVSGVGLGSRRTHDGTVDGDGVGTVTGLQGRVPSGRPGS